jgi:hypothetical protein
VLSSRLHIHRIQSTNNHKTQHEHQPPIYPIKLIGKKRQKIAQIVVHFELISCHKIMTQTHINLVKYVGKRKWQ